MRKILSSFLVLFLFFLSCSAPKVEEQKTPPLSQTQNTQTQNNSEKSSSLKAGKLTKAQKQFTSTYLDGTPFNSLDFEGERIIFAFFTFKHQDAPHFLQALAQLKTYQSKYRFRLFAVSFDGQDLPGLKQFIEKQKIDLPVLIDNKNADLAAALQVQEELSLRGLNNEHQIAFGLKKYVFADMPDGEAQFVNVMKEQLKIESYHSGTKPIMGIHPQAPDFKALTASGENISLSSLKNKVVFLLFYSPTCPHCHKEINFLKTQVYPQFRAKGFEIVAVSVLELQGQAKVLNDQLKMPWPVIVDSKREIRALYSQSRSIPEGFMIDQFGKIRYHSQGFSPQHANRIIMQIRHLLGLPNPTDLLSKTHFNGAETCMVCHEAEYVQWQTTSHAHAWQTLEVKGEEYNTECIGCHSLGFEDPKGYKSFVKDGKKLANAPDHLQNVSCENCHGIGGVHVSGPMTLPDMEKGCLECHTEKFSLHFDFKERSEKINHSNAEEILKLSAEERLALLEKMGDGSASSLFDKTVKYVGSQSCLQCHQQVHENWSQSVHAKAFDTLKSVGKQNDAACLQCHTVGYKELGGYHESQRDDLKGVGCESCHGPGETHVKTQKKKDIRGLGDDCPFCVVEQICLSCHDTANSPNFNIHKGLELLKDHGPKADVKKQLPPENVVQQEKAPQSNE